jgi:membrane protease YdiL (CAAX protease family)
MTNTLPIMLSFPLQLKRAAARVEIEEMAKTSEHTPPGHLAEQYWVQSRRPLASLLFVAPLLIAYELGVLLLGVHQTGADAFLTRLLELLGFGQHFVLPVLTVCILLAWHYLSRQPWQISGGIISAMYVESLLLGICLRAISFAQNAMVALSIGADVKQSIGFLGVGIYEELLFRLMLLSLLDWAIRHAGATPRASTIAAVILSSLLFAAAHHVGPYGDELHWSPFLFRTVAGAFFAILFLYRGFGIAAGTHAAYDIMVRLI